MLQPKRKDKPLSNGTPIASTRSVELTPEEIRLANKAKERSTTQEGKKHMAKAGVSLDTKGTATAKAYEKKFVKGDKMKGTKDAIYDSKGKLVESSKTGDKGGLAKKYKRTKAATESSRGRTSDVSNMQVNNADNEASKRRIEQDKASEKQRENKKIVDTKRKNFYKEGGINQDRTKK